MAKLLFDLVVTNHESNIFKQAFGLSLSLAGVTPSCSVKIG